MATTSVCMFLFPHILTQGRLLYTQHAILRTALQVHTRIVREEASANRSSQLRHTITRSPRKPGRIPHAIGVRPKFLTPSTHPKLGVKSRHKGLHRYALYRIFRPYLVADRSD